MARATILAADFAQPDARWRTRTSDPTADPRAVTYTDGQATLRVKPADNAAGFVTGDIGTLGRFEFTYGYAEARMRFQSPAGALGAFWLQTTEDYIPGQAEIDVAECGGRNVWHNVYWREPGQVAGEFTSAKRSTRLADQKAWHVYAVDWQPDRYDFYVDDVLVATIGTGLSDRPKYLVLSMLVRDWQLDAFHAHDMWLYRTRVDWVRVSQ